MMRRLIGVAGVALALVGCNEDPTRLSVVDPASAHAGLPRSATAEELAKKPALIARADDPKKGDAPGDEGPTSAEDLVKRGLEAAQQKNDLVGGIALFEKAHQLDPKNHDALAFLTLGRLLRAKEVTDPKEKTALALRAGESARALRDLAGKGAKPQETALIAQALVGEAGALARDGQADKAMASLSEAVDAGLADERALATAEDLAPLRGRPEFVSLATKVKDAARAASKKRDDAMTAETLPEVRREMASFRPFPFTFDLPGLDGKAVKLDAYKGKVTIVDVWGTWCPPCRAEIPHFIALADAYKDKGLAIVGINVERVPEAKVKETIESFAKEMGINYTLAIGNDKVPDTIPDFAGFPTTLFLDREGKVRYKHVGYAPYEVLEHIVKTLLDDRPKS